MHKKLTLPSKLCAVCGRPFNWRKKWQAVWNDVKYCSQRCRAQKAKGAAASGPHNACH